MSNPTGIPTFQDMSSDPFAEYRKNSIMDVADAPHSLPALQSVETPAALQAYCREHRISDESAKQIERVSVHPDWLEKAADVYNISPDLKNYATVPVVFMATDLPNRNLTAFPRDEMLKFNPNIGDLVYRGFKGKPVYIDHDNQTYSKALGAIVDVSMRKLRMRSGAIGYKVNGLLAIDTSKGTIPRDIISGRRTHYSIGAYVTAYSCSVCGKGGFTEKGMKSKFDCLPCKRSHAALDRDGNLRVYRHDDGSKTIGYLNAHNATPFEISTVPTPAYASATTPPTSLNYFYD